MAYSNVFTNEEVRNQILNVYAKFVSDVEPDRLFDWLVQEHVITIDQKKRMRHENPIASDRCRAILDHLFSIKHPRAFLVVRQALMEDNHYLLETIDNQEPLLKIRLQPEKQSALHAKIQELENDLMRYRSVNDDLEQRVHQLESELRSEKNKAQLEKRAWEVERDCLVKKQNELETKLQTDSGNKILDLEEKLKQEKTEKEQFRIVYTEEKKRRISDNLRRCKGPVLVDSIRTKAARKGDELYRDLTLTILDEELFIASEKSSEIEVYNSTKLSFSRQWNLKELIDPKDLVSCNGNKCLYIMDHKRGQSKEILRVDPNGKLIKKWSTEDNYGWGLSVTNELNVILTVFDKNKLIEYSSDGKLIREINLSSGTRICEPWHAMKLSNGDFLVSHGCTPKQLHRLCLVSADGKLKKSFGDTCDYDLRQMSQTFYLAIHGNGFVLVSDRCNSRVLLFDSDLKLNGVILSREKHSLQNPAKILLDESNGRLFVVEKDTRVFSMSGQRRSRKDNGQILIFDF